MIPITWKSLAHFIRGVNDLSDLGRIHKESNGLLPYLLPRVLEQLVNHPVEIIVRWHGRDVTTLRLIPRATHLEAMV